MNFVQLYQTTKRPIEIKRMLNDYKIINLIGGYVLEPIPKKVVR